MDLLKLWFREIRPSLGEDKKLSKYGIIGKIFLTGLREMPYNDDKNIMRVVSLESCMVHPTI